MTIELGWGGERVGGGRMDLLDDARRGSLCVEREERGEQLCCGGGGLVFLLCWLAGWLADRGFVGFTCVIVLQIRCLSGWLGGVFLSESGY